MRFLLSKVANQEFPSSFLITSLLEVGWDGSEVRTLNKSWLSYIIPTYKTRSWYYSSCIFWCTLGLSYHTSILLPLKTVKTSIRCLLCKLELFSADCLSTRWWWWHRWFRPAGRVWRHVNWICRGCSSVIGYCCRRTNLRTILCWILATVTQENCK